jgi:hypothetical protein
MIQRDCQTGQINAVNVMAVFSGTTDEPVGPVGLRAFHLTLSKIWMLIRVL